MHPSVAKSLDILLHLSKPASIAAFQLQLCTLLLYAASYTRTNDSHI